MRQISARVDDELHAAIERARGDVPRERWMRAVMLAATAAQPKSPPQAGAPAGLESRAAPVQDRNALALARVQKNNYGKAKW